MIHLVQLLILGIAVLTSGVAATSTPSESTPPPIDESAAAEASADFDTDPLATITALPEEITPTGYLLLPRVGDYRRAPLHVDPIEVAVAKNENWPAPKVGETVRSAAGKLIPWFAETDPLPLSALSGGYAYAEFDSPSVGVMLLEAPGCAAVWLNGEWIVGDPYSAGWFRPPVRVQEGPNRLLLHLARPSARAKFVKRPADVFLIADQATLPDVLTAQEADPLFGSIPLVNATDEPLEGLEVLVGENGPVRTLPTIAPRMIVPITFTIPPAPTSENLPKGSANAVKIQLIVRQVEKPQPSESQPSEKRAEEEEAEEVEKKEPTVKTVATVDLTLRVVEPSQPHVRTYVSSVDGSVQPYSVLPATDISTEDTSSTEEPPPGVLLVLHDAGEDHTAAAKQCELLSDLHVVLPGGRGAYGFDWEDWSATDALEALADFASRSPVDTDRISVTGHGMGGHGALHLGTIAPHRFAVVAPVEAWLSFYTQGSARSLPAEATPLETILARRASAADPMRALENLATAGVSVGHGLTGCAASPAAASLADSHLLRRRLSEFHTDFAYREAAEAGAIHSKSPLVKFCRRHRRTPADERNRIHFATHDLGLLTELGWARIDEQPVQGDLSRVRLERDLENRKIIGTTDNVSRLTLRLEGFEPDSPIRVRLDGSPSIEFDWPRRGGSLRLELEDANSSVRRWKKSRSTGARRADKRAERPGAFKSVFTNNPLLVYGTVGDEEANRWSLAKARYDAMLFLYRGAGRLEVISDAQFAPAKELGRNVVLYGSAATNQSLKLLFSNSPIQVTEGRVDVGARPEQGEDLSVLLVRPRPGSATASIALIGGTGPVGQRLTTRIRYFWSGVVYPDFLMFGPSSLDTNSIDTNEETIEDRFRGDVRASGDFGPDWQIKTGDILWRDMAL